MDTHQETEYVLSNPRLMQQIRQFKHSSKKSNPSQANLSLDFDYILKNPELITQIQLLIETHKLKRSPLSRQKSIKVKMKSCTDKRQAK